MSLDPRTESLTIEITDALLEFARRRGVPREILSRSMIAAALGVTANIVGPADAKRIVANTAAGIDDMVADGFGFAMLADNEDLPPPDRAA